MTAKRVLLSLLILIVLGGGVVAGVVLLKQRQQIEEKAAVPGGQAEVSILPVSGSYKVGDKIPVSVFFKTAGIAISSVSVRVRYPYSGTTPEVKAVDVTANPNLVSSGNWNCPTQTVTSEGGSVNIDIACAAIGASGYSTTTDTLLATFSLSVEKAPVNNPTVLSFDPSQSIVTKKSDGSDILKIPSGTGASGSYTVEGIAVVSASPVPSRVPSATTTPKPSVTTKVTPSVTPQVTATASATKVPTATKAPASLPSAGISYPTILLLGTGVMLVVGSMFLLI